ALGEVHPDALDDGIEDAASAVLHEAPPLPYRACWDVMLDSPSRAAAARIVRLVPRAGHGVGRRVPALVEGRPCRTVRVDRRRPGARGGVAGAEPGQAGLPEQHEHADG